MKTIIDLEIAPTERAAVTPCELLEDFADSTPAWHFLEEESRYYAALKGVCACILRHFQPEPYHVIDFVFSGCDAHAESALRLVMIDVAPPNDGMDLEARHVVVTRFADALRAYLDRSDVHAALHVVEDELAPTA